MCTHVCACVVGMYLCRPDCKAGLTGGFESFDLGDVPELRPSARTVFILNPWAIFSAWQFQSLNVQLYLLLLGEFLRQKFKPVYKVMRFFLSPHLQRCDTLFSFVHLPLYSSCSLSTLTGLFPFFSEFLLTRRFKPCLRWLSARVHGLCAYIYGSELVEVTGQLPGIGFSLPPCGLQESNSESLNVSPFISWATAPAPSVFSHMYSI